MRCDSAPTIFSIGHSNQSAEDFLGLLEQHRIDLVVDVRSQPQSRFAPQFNLLVLQKSLPAAGVGYLYLGRELGGRPRGDDYYDHDGHVLYRRVAASELFKTGLDRLSQAAQRSRVALMCSEEDPTDCHRRLLVGRVLGERRVEVAHIRGDGRLESDAELATRRPVQGALFSGEREDTWRSIRPVSPRRPPESSFRS